ncbi:MAG: CidA/LrgA family protein [Limnohabitans sp.]
MAQFDVDANPSERAAQGIPYVVVVPSDLLDAWASRMTMPLATVEFAKKSPDKLCPMVTVNGQHLRALAHYTAPPVHAQLAASGGQFGTASEHTDCGDGCGGFRGLTTEHHRRGACQGDRPRRQAHTGVTSVSPPTLAQAVYTQPMIQGLVQLFIFQALGELLSKFALPFIPGPVLGLVLLLAFLSVRGRVPAAMDMVGSAILQHLGLLFIPASVGVVLYLPLLQANAWAISAALVISVVATVAVAALVLKLLAGKD